MPAPRIVTFKGKKYFECLWTGVKLETCYAYPEFDKNGNRSKGGSFADAACAVAFLNEKLKGGKTKKMKLKAIAKDLELDGEQELLEAPECPPIEEYDFTYRSKYHWMYKPSVHLTLEEVLAWKEEKDEKEEEEKPPKRKVLIYDLEGDTVSPPLFKGSLIYSEKCDGVVFVGNQGAFNNVLDEKTGIKGFGEAVVIFSKDPKWKEKNVKRKRGDAEEGRDRVPIKLPKV